VHVFPYFNAPVARVSYWLVNCAGRTVRIFGNRFTCSYLTRKPEHYFSARTPFSTVDEVTSSFFDSIVVYAIYGDSRRGLHRRIVVRFFPFRSSFVIFYFFFFFGEEGTPTNKQHRYIRPSVGRAIAFTSSTRRIIERLYESRVKPTRTTEPRINGSHVTRQRP